MRHFLVAGIVGLVSAFGAEPGLGIGTSDGLTFSFEKNGRVAALRVDGKDAPLADPPGLFRVRDAVAKSPFVPVSLAVTQGTGGLVLNSRDRPLELDLSAGISQHGGFLQIDGELAARGTDERCIDLEVCLPVNLSGFVLGSGLYDGRAVVNRSAARKQAGGDADIDGSEPEDNAWYPVCPVSNRSGGIGLSLAVPPTHPTRFSIGTGGTGAHIIFRIGISPAGATPGRTSFRVIAYRHDAAWGFRSALARYYDFYREDFFTRHARRIGAWTTQNPSKLANPKLYAYHEAGFSTWRHPGGTDSGINLKPSLEQFDEGPVARTLEDYERLCELSLDERHGIYSLPYTIVGQRQLLQLPALPRNFDEAMEVLDSWSPRTSIPFDGPPQALSFRSADELKAIIRNSTLHDSEYRLAIFPRPYRGPTLTFPQNPNPNLFRDEPRPTIASYTLDYYMPMMLASKFVDGIYMDSLGRWCGFYNYRAGHFKYSTVPLTYQGSPPKVCLWNLQSHAEYMWEACKRLHAKGKILMANGISPERVMLGFACDVMGREGVPSHDVGEGFYAMRVAAGPKPFCLLNATHRVSARLWNSCLYMGYLMGCNAGPGLADEAKYLPLVIKCNEAGWQPVPHARATPAAVGVERWGGQSDDGPLFFTLMNRSLEPVTAELTLNAAAMNRTAGVRAIDLVAGRAIEGKIAGKEIVLNLKLGPEQATVIELRN